MNNYINTKIQHKNSRPLLMISIIVVFVIVGISMWFLKQRTLQNPRAAASTTLTFTPSTKNITAGEAFTSSIVIDPGTNQVSLVKLVISYDGSLVTVTSDGDSLVYNKEAFPQTLEPPTTSCNGTECTLSATFSVGSDPTKAIQTKTTVALLNMKALANGATDIGFNQTTAVYSVAPTDQASENVLSSTTPLHVSIGGVSGETPTPILACQQNTSNCHWDPRPSATSYHYIVEDTRSSNVVKEGDTNLTNVDFPSEAGKTYKCTVTATNACKTSNPKATTVTCPVPSIMPSVTPTGCMGPGTVKNLHIICPDCNTGNK